MNIAIIEFDALPDGLGATENHDLLGIGLLEFVLFPIGRIIVWSIGLEFRRAGINQPKDSTDPQVLATLTGPDGSHFQRSANCGRKSPPPWPAGTPYHFQRLWFRFPCQSDESVRVGW